MVTQVKSPNMNPVLSTSNRHCDTVMQQLTQAGHDVLMPLAVVPRAAATVRPSDGGRKGPWLNRVWNFA